MWWWEELFQEEPVRTTAIICLCLLMGSCTGRVIFNEWKTAGIKCPVITIPEGGK